MRTITCASFNHIQLLLLTNQHCAKDGIRTLVDVVIVDPIQTDLFFGSCTTQGFVTSNAIQAKEKSYHN
jgi:hypothetical protein